MTPTTVGAKGKANEELFELKEDVSGSPLWNEDLAPVPRAKRNWTTYNFAALWVSMAHCIPTYMLASGLISKGMNWWQALLTILLGNVIVLIPILLNSHPGTKYGIPFPVFARASYGTIGSNLPAIMRALVACAWFGIQAWIGGQAIHLLFRAIYPGWPTLLGDKIQAPIIGGYTATEYISFIIFWLINIFIVYRGMNLLRKVENWAAPFVLVMAAVLLVWAIWKANGLGSIMQAKHNFDSFGAFMKVFAPMLTAMIGFWATLSLNMPDFTRFGRSQREQMVGQVVALPTTMTIFSAMGVVITSAAMIIYPHMNQSDVWDPVKLVGQFSQTWLVAVSMFTIVVATLSVNIAANVVSPANDFANAFPKWISFKTGGLITGIIGIIVQPWRLLEDADKYFGYLGTYSGALGSIAAVLIVDYWLIRRKELKVADLYKTSGVYTYAAGWNWCAVVATLLGCAIALGGKVVPQMALLLDYAWFVGFFVSGASYYLLMSVSKQSESVPSSVGS